VKRRTLVALGVLAIPMCVLGYGYWFARSHGSLFVSVTDVSDRAHQRPLSPVLLTFLNAEGRALAEAAADPTGVAYPDTLPSLAEGTTKVAQVGETVPAPRKEEGRKKR